MSLIVKLLALLGIIIGLIVTALGVAAVKWPVLDIVNDGLPFVVMGAVMTFALALISREPRLVFASALVLALNLMLVFIGYQGGAPKAASGSQRFLRVVTFNIWEGNPGLGEIASFLRSTNADVVVLEELSADKAEKLHGVLGSLYPYTIGKDGIVIFSKFEGTGEGNISRPSFQEGQPVPILRWATLDVNGRKVDFAGAHLARPFYPELQARDLAAVTNFARSHIGPMILAGDFNATPWSKGLQGLEAGSGLLRFNTFHPTWPMQWDSRKLFPVVAIDHVFASPGYEKIDIMPGPRLGSDHRAVIADIAIGD